MPGDHPFIKHESVILFADARKLDTRNIEAALNATSLAVVCKSHSACNPKLLKRIQEGLLLSKTVPRGIKALRPTAKRNGAWRNSEMADHLLDDMD
jgi:hypothetical protein